MELNSSEADMDLLDFAKHSSPSQSQQMSHKKKSPRELERKKQVLALLDLVEQRHRNKVRKTESNVSDGEKTEEDESVAAFEL